MLDVKQLTESLVNSERTPLVLTAVGCIGVISTAVLAAQAGTKADYILEKERYDREEDIPFVEAAKLTWKVYVPTVVSGALTITSIVCMNRIHDRSVMLLTSGATIAANTLKNYQKHVLDEIGVEKESKIRDKMAKHTINNAPPAPTDGSMFILGEGEVTCYDSLSGRYFKHSFEEIRAIENDLNRRLLNEMYMPLNDLYEAFGLEPIKLGDTMGFNIDHMIEFHFSSQLSPQNKPVLVLGYINLPVVNFMRVV